MGKEMWYTVCNLVDSLCMKMDGSLGSRNVKQTYDMKPCCASPFSPPALLILTVAPTFPQDYREKKP